MTKRLLCAFLALVMVIGLVPLSTFHVHAASAMKASDDVILYLKTMEGFTPIPRWDYVQWTVGYGNRCPDEDLERYLETGIPIEEADALFLDQLVYFEDQVNAFIDRHGLHLEQHEFDAVLSVTYNCGAAWLLGENDLREAIINGTRGNTLIALLTHRCTAGGEYLPGLMRRRLTEADMFLNGRYNTQALENYCYVFFDAGEGTASSVAQGYDCNLYAVPMATAKRDGYTFLGWYTAKTGGAKVTYLDENLHQTTLYAHWAQGDGGYDGGSTTIPDGVLVTVTGDVVNVRTGPSTTYPVVASVVAGDKIAITEVTKTDGRLWGLFEKGWLCLEYTNYTDMVPGTGDDDNQGSAEEERYKVPVYATVIGVNSLKIYNGPHTGYPTIGTLTEGQEVLLVETYKLFDTWWARLESGGWVCLNRYLLLHNDNMLAHSVTVTVTNSYLNVRSGPGTSNSWVSSLNKGDVVTILAVETVGNTIWGQFSGGWISLEYTTFDSSKLEQYWNHHYGEWYPLTDASCIAKGTEQRKCKYCDRYETRETDYADHIYTEWRTVEEATCVTPGQQQRECVVCGNRETQQIPLTGHSFGQWYESKTATCVEQGEERRDCAHCDVFETRETGFGEHSFGQWYITVDPTLTDFGEERRDCELCDAYETRSIDPVDHIYGEWYTSVDPTCTEPGQERRDCLDCDHYETREVPALGHSFGDWYTLVDASCTEPGEERRDCRNCEHHETREVPAMGHSYSQWQVIQQPTCTTEGQRQCACDLCGDVKTESISATGHTMGQWYTVQEATCTENGLQRRECANCDHAEESVLSPKGHALGDWYLHLAPNCTENGENRRVCSNCDYYESESIPANGHSYGDWYTYREATLGNPGEDRRDCFNCDHFESRETECLVDVITRTYGTLTGYSYLRIRSGPGVGYALVGQLNYGDRVEIFEIRDVGDVQWARIALGWVQITGYLTLETVEEQVEHTHKFGDWYTVTEATPDQKGLERRDCVCGYSETRETVYTETVTKLYGILTGHSYLNIRSGPATNYDLVGQLKQGDRIEILEIKDYGTIQWARFDRGWVQITGYLTLETVEEPVEHTHSFGAWYTVTAATCTASGLEQRDCACGEHETRTVAATGHSFGAWYTTTEPTCTAAGQQRRECACGAYETKPVSATGHSYGDWQILQEATCTEDGLQKRECACGASETKTIAATGHTFGDWYTVTEPAAGTSGLERRDCACGHYETRELECPVETVTKTYGTLTGYSYLRIRSGPGVGYDLVGQLNYGDRVEIFEIRDVGNVQWARIQRGWVQITGYLTLDTVEEIVEHTHSYGDWYTVTEATADANGLERRDCACGHYETRETEYEGNYVTKVYATITTASLNVRNGAGTNYSRVTTVQYGTRHEVYEQVAVGDKIWGRIDAGWICLTGYTSLEYIREEATPEPLRMRVIADVLNIRSGAGSGYEVVGTLVYGNWVEVLEQVTVDGVTWARIEQGWVSMAYLA